MAATGVRRRSPTVVLFVILSLAWVMPSTAGGCPMDAKKIYVEVEPPITGWFTRDGSVHFVRKVLSTTFTLTLYTRLSGLVKTLEVLEPDISAEKILLNYASDAIKVTCPGDVLDCTCRRFEISGLEDYNGIYSLNQLPEIHSNDDVALDGNVAGGDGSDSNDDFFDKVKVALPLRGHADVPDKQTWSLIEERGTNFSEAVSSWWNHSADGSSGDAEDRYNYNNWSDTIYNNNEQSEENWSTPQTVSSSQKGDPRYDRIPNRKITRRNETKRISNLLKAQIVQEVPSKDKTNRIREGKQSSVWPGKHRTEKDSLANIYSIFQKELDSGELKKPSKSYAQDLLSKADPLVQFLPFEEKKLIQQTQSSEKKTRAAHQFIKLFPTLNKLKTLPKPLHDSSNFELIGQGSLGKRKSMKLPKDKISQTNTSEERRSPELAASSNALGILGLDWFSRALAIAPGDIKNGEIIDRNNHTGEEHLAAAVNTILHHFHVPTIKMDDDMETWILEYDEIPLAISDQRALCPDQSSGDWWQLLHGNENASVPVLPLPLSMFHVTGDDESSITTEAKVNEEDTSDPTYENNDYHNESTSFTSKLSSPPSQDGAVLVKRRVKVTCLDSSDNSHPQTGMVGGLA